MKMWNRLRENRKDRNIALIFAALLLYVLAEFLWQFTVQLLTGVSLQGFMMSLFPDKMTYANYPGSYGNLFVATLGLTVIAAVWQGLWRKGWKSVLAAVAVGGLVSLGILGAFYLHCSLIVSTGGDSGAFHGTVYCHSGTDRVLDLELDAGRKEDRELAELCFALTPYGRAEQKKLNAECDINEQNVIHIWLIYPEKYGHTFWLHVRVAEEYIFIEQSSAQGADKTFYRDNGLLEKLKALTKMDNLHE